MSPQPPSVVLPHPVDPTEECRFWNFVALPIGTKGPNIWNHHNHNKNHWLTIWDALPGATLYIGPECGLDLRDNEVFPLLHAHTHAHMHACTCPHKHTHTQSQVPRKHVHSPEATEHIRDTFSACSQKSRLSQVLLLDPTRCTQIHIPISILPKPQSSENWGPFVSLR